MYIIKRDGRKQPVYYDKITARNMKLAADLLVDTVSLSQTVIRGLSSGMTARDIDQLSCESAIYRSIYEPDYGILSSRIAWNDLHKTTPDTFNKAVDILYSNYNSVKHRPNPLLSLEIYNFAKDNMEEVEQAIDHKKDYEYSYFAYRTLGYSYLQKVDGNIVERPQYMLMRVNLGIHGPSRRNGIIHEGNIKKALISYKAMAERKFTHASPTLFNAGTTRPQLSSCFLLEVPDSMGDDPYDPVTLQFMDISHEDSIQKCMDHCFKISKNAGGIGLTVTKVRCRGSYIAGSNGRSSGVIPLIKVFNEIARYVDQGGKRKGAISLYLEPWHPDTPEFLEIRLPIGSEELRAKDIFPALWMPDLFFKRLESGGMWSFFCPNSYPELIQLYGDKFEERYIELESSGKMCRQMKASDLWERVLKSLDKSGLPYMLSKDSVNEKSNHKNVGTVTSSNLCCEIVQYHDPKSIGVCNLASICLPEFVCTDSNGNKYFDFQELGRIVEIVTENLNLIIDKNYYPVKYCFDNNIELRPIGIGVQGLADLFAMFHIVWESQEAIDMNKAIFETIYYYAVKKSASLAGEFGSYGRFVGSPVSQGILQYDMWNVQPITRRDNTEKYTIDVPKYNWTELKEAAKLGMRNSLLIAPMPTAGTSQIMGNNEAFEPFTSNIYTRKVLAGDFPLVNNHLYKDLLKIGKWNKENVDIMIGNNGSVQKLDIPQKLKDVYKTVWEISQKTIIDLAADRGAFIDQSQSMNIHIERPTPSKLSSMYIYAWKKGLKTLSYYMRSLATVDAVKFTIMDISDPTQKITEEMKRQKAKENGGQKDKSNEGEEYICNGDVCIPCGS